MADTNAQPQTAPNPGAPQQQPPNPTSNGGPPGQLGVGNAKMQPISAANAEPKPAEPKAEAPPVDPRAKLEAAIKEAGGVKVKANGKERSMTLDELVRAAQRGLPYEETAAQLAKEKEALAPKIKLLEAIEKGDVGTARQALRSLLGERTAQIALAETEDLIRAEEQHKGETERERAYRQRYEELERRNQQLAESQQAREAEERRVREEHEVNSTLQQLNDAVLGAFKMLDLDSKMEPDALQAVQPLIRKLVAAGIPVTPELLAEHIEKTQETSLSWMMKRRGIEGMAKLLGSDFAKQFQKMLLQKMKPNSSQPQPAQQPQNGNDKNRPQWGDPARWRL